MKKDFKYEDAPEDIREALLEANEVENILPPPKLLIPKEETKKVTISLSKKALISSNGSQRKHIFHINK